MEIGTKLMARDGEKLSSKLPLEDGEHIVLVAFCSNWKPSAIDRLVITNRRVIGSPLAWPKPVWQAPLNGATLTADADEKTVTITSSSGEAMTFKKVPAADHARIRSALDHSSATTDTLPVPRASLFETPATPAVPPAVPAQPKQGLLAKASAAVKKAAEETEAKFQKARSDAGALVLTKVFAGSTVEIYERGYVRVSSLMTKSTPFEKLLSVKYTQQVQDKSAGGRAIAGMATMGLSYMASKEKRTLFLTIATDRKVHTLTAGGDMLRTEDKAGLSIEAAAQGVLAAAAASAVQAPHIVVQAPAAAAPHSDSLADQIKKLADLRDSGILSEEEFSAAKQRLISGR